MDPKGVPVLSKATELVSMKFFQIKHCPTPQVAENWVRRWGRTNQTGFDSQHSDCFLSSQLK